MAHVYVRSGAGGAGTGADWANAYTTLSAAFAASGFGDDFWVAADHAESTAGAVSLANPGTIAAPCRIICVNHAGTVPPVAADMRTTATVSTTGTNAITFPSSATLGYGYWYGITFQAGSAANAANIIFTASNPVFDSCGFTLNNSSATSSIPVGTSSQNSTNTFLNCTFTFGSTSQGINPRPGVVTIRGGSIGGATFPNVFIGQTSGTAQFATFLIDGFDFTNLSGKTIVGAMNNPGRVQCVNCKLPASITLSATPTSGQINEFIICDSGSGNTRHERYMYGGTAASETTIVRSGGASDGTTPYSVKVVTNANAKALVPVELPQIAVWNSLVGSSRTATIEIVNDGTTLTNAEIWMEVEYLGNASFPISSVVSSAPATVLTTATNLPTSSVTWTTTGLGSPVKQYLQVTFTPQLAGLVRAVVKVAKASKTIYVDNDLVIA